MPLALSETHLPDDNNEKVEGVPYAPNVGSWVEDEPVRDDFHEAF